GAHPGQQRGRMAADTRRNGETAPGAGRSALEEAAVQARQLQHVPQEPADQYLLAWLDLFRISRGTLPFSIRARMGEHGTAKLLLQLARRFATQRRAGPYRQAAEWDLRVAQMHGLDHFLIQSSGHERGGGEGRDAVGAADIH